MRFGHRIVGAHLIELCDAGSDAGVDDARSEAGGVRAVEHPIRLRAPSDGELRRQEVARRGQLARRIRAGVDARLGHEQIILHTRVAGADEHVPGVVQPIADFAEHGLFAEGAVFRVSPEDDVVQETDDLPLPLDRHAVEERILQGAVGIETIVDGAAAFVAAVVVGALGLVVLVVGAGGPLPAVASIGDQAYFLHQALGGAIEDAVAAQRRQGVRPADVVVEQAQAVAGIDEAADASGEARAGFLGIVGLAVEPGGGRGECADGRLPLQVDVVHRLVVVAAACVRGMGEVGDVGVAVLELVSFAAAGDAGKFVFRHLSGRIRRRRFREAMEAEARAAVVAVDDVDHGRKLDVVIDVPCQLDAAAVLQERVDVFLVAGRHLVENAHPIPPIGDDARRNALAQRDVQHGIGAIGEPGRLADVFDIALRGVVERRRIRLFGDVAYRAAQVAFAVQRALRALEHLHALQVEQGAERLRQAAGVAVRHRQVVHVDAHHRPAAAGRRGQAAHREGVVGLRVGAIGEAGDGLVEGLDVLDALGNDVHVGDRRDGQRRIHQAGVAIGRRDDDLLDFAASGVLGLLLFLRRHAAGEQDGRCADGDAAG